MAKKEILLLIFIIAIGAFFRFYLLTEIPPGLYIDEAANGNNAVEALETGSFKIFYPENTGREGLFINIQALSVWVFGNEPWALRLVSAIFGVLTILGIYLLAKELFRNYQFSIINFQSSPNESIFKRLKIKKLEHLLKIRNWKIENYETIALLSAFFLATSYWHINFSRIGFRAILIPFLATFGMYWLLKGLRTGKISSFLLAGFFSGLGFHSYIAFRFMPLVFIIPLIFAFAKWWRGKFQFCMPCGIALFLLVGIVVAIPIGYYFLQNPDDFFGRSKAVSIFSAASPMKEFIKSNALTMGMFFFRGDCNFRHNYACNPFLLVGLLASLGLIVLLRRRSIANNSLPVLLLPLWLLIMSLPATLTRESVPHALRSIGIMPPLYILAGFGAWWIIEKSFIWLRRQKEKYPVKLVQLERIKKEAVFLLILFLFFVPFSAFIKYFQRWAYDPRTEAAFSIDLAHIGKYLNTLPGDTRKFVIVNHSDIMIRGISAAAQVPMFFTNTFSEKSRIDKRIYYIQSADEISFKPEESVVIIPMDQKTRKEIAERFPGFKAKIKQSFVAFENF